MELVFLFNLQFLTYKNYFFVYFSSLILKKKMKTQVLNHRTVLERLAGEQIVHNEKKTIKKERKRAFKHKAKY